MQSREFSTPSSVFRRQMRPRVRKELLSQPGGLEFPGLWGIFAGDPECYQSDESEENDDAINPWRRKPVPGLWQGRRFSK